MSRLYDEALLDAQKIREVAEQSAKERVLEAITPQIREMINNRILFEQDSDLVDFNEEEPDDDSELRFDSIVDKMPDVDLDDDVMSAAADAAISVYAAGDVNIEVENELPESSGDEKDEIMLDDVMSEAFMKLIRKDFFPDKELSEKIDKLSTRTQKLKSIMSVLSESRLSGTKRRRLELSFISLIKEAVSLQYDLKHSERGSQRLEQKLNSTIKEMREMSSKYKRNIFDFLFEAEEDKDKMEGMMHEQDEAEAEEAEVEVEAEDVDVDAASAALEDLGDALGLDLEIAEEPEGEGDEDDDDDDEDDELDLDEGEMHEMMMDADHNEGMDEMYEISESALRRELKRMRRRRLQEQEEAVDTYASPGEAEDLGDVILDVDEEDLINALADELGPVSAGAEVEPEELAESRRPRARRSSALRKALREAAEYKSAATSLKKQLVEMNLFNAKLLYANKLLQNKNLNVKQQRAIVEALDNAKTLREAKLLYKSLSDSLARRGRGGKNLSESVRRTLGSSSRSTRSAQPSKSGVETDRWAVLAGIGK